MSNEIIKRGELLPRPLIDETNGLKRTKPDKNGHLMRNELTPQQEIAIEMMMDGKKDLEISKRLKMRRPTINEWRNHNMDFIYELQMRRSQVWEKQRDKMSRAVDKAFDILIKNLDNKDEKIQLAVAMQLVRMTGVQENLKNKNPMDLKTFEANKFNSDLKQALEEVTTEMGFNK